eukprot:gnl/MRDRNA2_/MRDRNA2_139094_c0_seq1.p1 gnl/MRDRNA2_/MRDRNA2_139094_c0~~gnl/MRDRNA2_/MRDRNA2_139094_c0_seq1.p1  ORF type:complete len:830 (+),score=182.15 gnl/MRDRNA2_/MRDRNA2_139094_c0_seq1:30-2492(+)
MFGALVTASPLQEFPEGKYFEVELVETRLGMPDGLAIGVTNTPPDEVSPDLETADLIECCTTVGYDGQSYDGWTEEWKEVPWNPGNLRVGDHVGIIVTPDGAVGVMENGSPPLWFAELGKEVARQELFGVVDLIGSARGVKLIANSPGGGSSSSSSPRGVEGKKPYPQSSQTPSTAASEASGRQGGLMAAALRFEPSSATELVKISSDCLRAKYVGESTDEMYGVVLSRSPVIPTAAGHYFEVEIEMTSNKEEPDGLCLGYTLLKPQEVAEGEAPQTADMLDNTWVIGYDGQAWDGIKKEWMEVDWNPSIVNVGDHVGALITPQGEFQIFVNGQLRARGPTGIHGYGEMYAVVNLMGAVTAVSFLPTPAPGRGALELAGQRAMAELMHRGPMNGFARGQIGKLINLFPDGKTAKVLGDVPSGDALVHGCLIGDGFIPESPEGFYFEVEILQVGSGKAGLGVGVIAGRPPGGPPKLEILQPLCLVGYEGQMWDSSRNVWRGSEWSPKGLNSGDRVGVLVNDAGMSVFVQEKLACRVPLSNVPPQGSEVFAVVDLYGCTREIALISKAQPPSIACASSGSRRGSIKLGPRDDTATRWAKGPVSEFVKLSENGTRATHLDPGGDSMCGGLISDGPIPIYSEGFYFAVQVESQVPDQPDGLVVGVTLTSPDQVTEMPVTVDNIDATFAAGYDGQAYDGEQGTWQQISWNPCNLKVGDRVGVLVSTEGEMWLFINDKLKEELPIYVPVNGSQLFAVADLLGSTSSISFLPNVRPPPSAAQLSSAIGHVDHHRGSFTLPNPNANDSKSNSSINSALASSLESFGGR